VLDAHRKQIDAMTQVEMARLWRFAPIGHPLFAGDTGDYFRKVFFEQKGGLTPAISRELGWERSAR